MLTSSFFKNRSESIIALLVILLIAIVFLFPMFLGKVDTPTDIRNIQMYPWRYYSVDKNIKKHVLWERIFNQSETIIDKEINEKVFDFRIPPNQIHTLKFYPEYDKALLNKLNDLKDRHYYLTFDFKSKYSKLGQLKFGVQFVVKNTTKYLRPKALVYPSEFNKEYEKPTWHRIYVPLQGNIPLNNLNNYDIHIVAKNPSKSIISSLYITNLKIICEDSSNVVEIHNPYNNDLVQGFTPNREAYSNSIKKFKIPFWYNELLTGLENIADPQMGYFHPIFFVIYFLFDHFTAHLIVLFVSFVLCGFGAFTLCRFWRLSFYPSLLASIVYMFHPFNMIWFSFEHIIMNSATLPFLLLSYEKNLRAGKLLNRHLLISALLLGLIFLSGHLQVSYYTAIFFVMFASFKFLQSISFYKKSYFSYIRQIVGVIFICAIGLMMCGVVLVPLVPFVSNSYRVSWSDEMIKSSAIPLKAFLGLIYPYYMGKNSSAISEPVYGWGFARNYVYFGLIPFLLALFSLRVIFRNKLGLFFFVTIFFSFLICTASPFFFLIKDYIPGFKQFQSHRFIEVYSYCVPFLAGFGLQTLINFLSFIKDKNRIIILLTILLITTFDLMFYSSYFVTWSDRKSYKPLPEGGSLKFILDKMKTSHEPFRILSFVVDKAGNIKFKQGTSVALPNTLLPYGIEEVSGYSSFVPEDLYSLFVYIQTKDPKKLYPQKILDVFPNTNIPYPVYNFRSKILDLLNVRYFLVPYVLMLDSENTKKVFVSDCTIYENKDYLPRAYIVPKYKLIKSKKGTIVKLDSEDFNPREEVILMSFPLQYKQALQQANKELASLKYNIEFKKYNNEKTTLKVNVNRPSILVLASNLNQNWKAKINGENTELYQANLVQKAVYLPGSGNYTIEFYYFPKLFFIGLSISFSAVFILIVLALILKYRKNHVIPLSEEEYNESNKIIMGV